MIPKQLTICLFTLIIVAGFQACNKWDSQSENFKVVAKYRDKVLGMEQLGYYLPPDMTPEDSSRYARYYIDQWVMEQAVVDVADQNLPDLDQMIRFKVEDYRQKLILHEYNTWLLKNKFDTTLTEAELRKYYNQEKKQFLSKTEWHNYFYLVTASNEIGQMRKWMESDNPESLKNLKDWAKSNALDVKLDTGFVEVAVLARIGKGYYGNLAKVQEGKLIRWNGVIQGQRRRYFFKHLKTINPGAPLPFSLVKDKIRIILLNERKIKMIEDMEEEVVRNAKARNYITTNF